MERGRVTAGEADRNGLPAGSQYARYMRTDELLGLQPEEDGDELLFVSTHQATELLLRAAAAATVDAAQRVQAGEVSAAEVLLRRACETVRAATGLLPVLSQLSPLAFGRLRPRLGNGSGAESPGWRGLRGAGRGLQTAFEQRRGALEVSLVQLYRGRTHRPLYRLAEAMVDLDEAVRVWRLQHFVLAQRVVGGAAVGTQGMPVDALGKLISQRMFPALWSVRDDLSVVGGELVS